VANAGLPLARRLFEGQEWVVERRRVGMRRCNPGGAGGKEQRVQRDKGWRAKG
jgi:hypothetical protein